MSNDIVPEGQASGWTDLLEELNLPKLVLGPAGEALSRLVGHVADVPAEYVKTFTQGIKDKREARTEVSKALAKAVSSEVATDRELVRRAAQSFLAKELRAQTNKEAVAEKAIKHLSNKPEPSDQSPKTPDDDWLNIFERYAENASSEKLRDLWGRVLAKEIRKPRSFSLRTMRFVSELDSETAKLFEKHSPEIIDESFILKPSPFEGLIFTEYLELENAGLLTGAGGNISQSYRSDQPGDIPFLIRKSAVLVRHAGPININLPAMLVTNVGKELLGIVDLDDGLESARAVAEKFPRGGLSSVQFGKLNETRTGIVDAITAWEQPSAEQAAKD